MVVKVAVVVRINGDPSCRRRLIIEGKVAGESFILPRLSPCLCPIVVYVFRNIVISKV